MNAENYNADALAALATKVGAYEYGEPAQRYYDFTAAQLAQFAKALAARQPGVQEAAVTGPYLDEPDAPSNPLWKRLRSIANWLTVLAPNSHMEAAELLLIASARIKQIDAAPPAQGIDLGQFRPVVLDRRMEAVADGKHEAVRECDRLLALIDDQRDAAPGVGS